MNSLDLKNDSYLSIEGVSKKFEQFQAVRHTNLKIRKGEIFCLLGPSGCGKTTLLRMLAGFEQPSEGKIFLDGSELTGIPPFRRPVNMMFQSYAIFPHMTVEQNVAFGLKQDQVAKDKIREKVQEALELVEMPKLAKR
ncbi:MAG: ABC transporter ATP-binding protein, partial [SAR324 cluster bacterium]|nr:ABC transporter ATP-binding protein [SAR324 cluster bacterium]